MSAFEISMWILSGLGAAYIIGDTAWYYLVTRPRWRRERDEMWRRAIEEVHGALDEVERDQ